MRTKPCEYCHGFEAYVRKNLENFHINLCLTLLETTYEFLLDITGKNMVQLELNGVYYKKSNYIIKGVISRVALGYV
jgi:hypothetical protein